MAYIRQLPSGKYQATIRLPDGSRLTETHRLRKAVERWARDQEDDLRRGEWIDPRAGEVTVGDWWERVRASRRLELASRRRDESHWRTHVEPRWARTPVGAILKPDVSTWVVDMEEAGVGAATIQGALGVLRAALEAAVDAKLRRDNPARGVKTPRRDAHLDRVLAPEEDGALLAAIEEVAPGRPDGRLMADLLLYCGLRFEEAGALDREHVIRRTKVISIGPVLERDGTIRPYPKSPAGVRPVPVDDAVWPRLLERALAIPTGGLVVTAPEGGVLHYSTWLRRVWKVALGLAELANPQPTPHDLRHTYGTRLGEQGVPPHEIMALMGHERLESVQRYLHAGDLRFDRARKAVARGREPVRRAQKS